MTNTGPYSIQNPPDGGWGWVIVAAAFLTFFMTTGTMMAMSVMYVAWLEEFHTGRGLTSWIISVAVAVMFGIGPVPAQLAIRLGYKAVMFIGGILAFAGFVMSVFATNVPMLIFTIGIVTGTGLGFCFLPAIAMVSLYFDKRRSIAMGIAAAGAGIGSLVGAQILHRLVEMFGWRGATLIAGAMQLNLTVLALLMRPLPNRPVAVTEVEIVAEDKDVTESLLNGDDQHCSTENDEKVAIVVNGTRESHANGKPKLSITSNEDIESFRNHIQSSMDGSSNLLKIPLSMNPQHRRLLAMEGGAGNTRSESLQHLAVPRANHTRMFASHIELNRRNLLHSREKLEKSSSTKHSGNLDILYSGSMHSLFLVNNKTLKYDDSYSHHSMNIDASSSSTGEDTEDSEGNTTRKSRRRNTSLLTSCLASAANYINLLKDPYYLMFIISNILTNLSFFMPNLYMVDRALDEGIDKNWAAIIVSVNGAGNVFGRLFFGWLADKNIMQRISWYIFVLGVCGIATCFSPLCGGSVALHALYAFTFGCFIGAYVTLAPVVTVDLVGVEVVGQAYGLALFFMGASGLIGAPLAGWIFDWTGNYTTSFVVHGLFLFISAIVLIPVAILTGRRKRAAAAQS